MGAKKKEGYGEKKALLCRNLRRGGGEETRTRRRKIEESKGKGGGGIKSA